MTIQRGLDFIDKFLSGGYSDSRYNVTFEDRLFFLNRLYRHTQFILNFFGVNENGANNNIANQRFVLEAQEFLIEWIDEMFREQFMINIVTEDRHEIILGLAELAMNHIAVTEVVNAVTNYVNDVEEQNVTEGYEEFANDELQETIIGDSLIVS